LTNGLAGELLTMNEPPSSSSSGAPRLVVIGRNSVLWSRIADRVLTQHPDSLAVGHRDVAAGLQLSADDCVWIFSYAPDADANRQLFERLKRLGAGHYVYLSTATANIAADTSCYRYPRVKREAERDAAQTLDAAIVRIGLIYDDPAELPAGTSAATRLDDLIAAMVQPDCPPQEGGRVVPLYRLVERPFGSSIERAAFAAYGALLRLSGPYPCLLRPIDLLLRSIGWRWYGYLRLSNERCLSTT
jgi:hypothetical protein